MSMQIRYWNNCVIIIGMTTLSMLAFLHIQILGWANSSCKLVVLMGTQMHNNWNKDYEYVKTLGQGTHGTVVLIQHKSNGGKLAVKSISKKNLSDGKQLNLIRREIEIMTHLKHPHIVSVFDVYESDSNVTLVMEYANGGELFDYVNESQGLSEDESCRIFSQVVSAVRYLHKNGFVHRDLKLENILLDSDNNAKIADFSLANSYGCGKLLTTYCGSPLYASPEIVKGEPYEGPEVDCWSLGVLLYTLTFGLMPFDGSDFKKLKQLIINADYLRLNTSSGAANLIDRLLVSNVSERATIEEVYRHWWINKDCIVDELYSEDSNCLTFLPQLVSFHDGAGQSMSNGYDLESYEHSANFLKQYCSEMGNSVTERSPSKSDERPLAINGRSPIDGKSRINERLVSDGRSTINGKSSVDERYFDSHETDRAFDSNHFKEDDDSSNFLPILKNMLQDLRTKYEDDDSDDYSLLRFNKPVGEGDSLLRDEEEAEQNSGARLASPYPSECDSLDCDKDSSQGDNYSNDSILDTFLPLPFRQKYQTVPESLLSNDERLCLEQTREDFVHNGAWPFTAVLDQCTDSYLTDRRRTDVRSAPTKLMRSFSVDSLEMNFPAKSKFAVVEEISSDVPQCLGSVADSGCAVDGGSFSTDGTQLLEPIEVSDMKGSDDSEEEDGLGREHDASDVFYGSENQSGVYDFRDIESILDRLDEDESPDPSNCVSAGDGPAETPTDNELEYFNQFCAKVDEGTYQFETVVDPTFQSANHGVDPAFRCANHGDNTAEKSSRKQLEVEYLENCFPKSTSQHDDNIPRPCLSEDSLENESRL